MGRYSTCIVITASPYGRVRWSGVHEVGLVSELVCWRHGCPVKKVVILSDFSVVDVCCQAVELCSVFLNRSCWKLAGPILGRSKLFLFLGHDLSHCFVLLLHQRIVSHHHLVDFVDSVVGSLNFLVEIRSFDHWALGIKNGHALHFTIDMPLCFSVSLFEYLLIDHILFRICFIDQVLFRPLNGRQGVVLPAFGRLWYLLAQLDHWAWLTMHHYYLIIRIKLNKIY